MKKFVSLVLLLGMFALQAHVLLHADEHGEKHAKGKAHDECQVCSVVLAQVAVSPQVVPPLSPVSLPFAIAPSCQSLASAHTPVSSLSLRGPPAANFS